MKQNFYTERLLRTWHTIEVERKPKFARFSITNRHGNTYFLDIVWNDRKSRWIGMDDFGNEKWSIKGALTNFLYSCWSEMRNYDQITYEGLDGYSSVSWMGKDVSRTAHGVTYLLSGYEAYRSYKLSFG